MGLSVSLSNALSGMRTTQKGLEVLSRNVSNEGTPGYHRQSVTLTDTMGVRSAYAHLAGVERAFSESLQRHFNGEVSHLGEANVRSEFMARVETALGMPGDPTSLDTLYQEFENAMQTMATSPDDYTARAQVLSNAQLLASSLNNLSNTVQGLRQETENQISNHVSDLNRMLQSLDEINNNLTDQTDEPTSRAIILDERDRLVAAIAEVVDVQVDYRGDDTVAVMTSAGFGLLDSGATVLQFESAGSINATSKFSLDDAENSVGSLYATTPSGLRIDLVEQGVIQSGRIGGLIEMRDDTLVEIQEQLDEIATGLASALSTIEKTVDSGDVTAITGPPDGFSLDIGDLRAGNDFTVSYVENGVSETVRVVRVDDTSKLPMDETGPSGERVIGLDFSGGIGAVATALDTALGAGISVSNPSGTVLQIVDDGVAGTTDISSLSARATSSALQGSGLSISLFVDSGNSDFTNSLDGATQKLGFSSRISINTELVADNSLLVKHTSATSLGDATRAVHMLDQLQNMQFTAANKTSPESGNFRLVGSAQSMISQMLNFQGTSISQAKGVEYASEMSLEAVTQKMDAEYGVNIDEEMARLMELQNAYAASARIVSTVQELIDELMRI